MNPPKKPNSTRRNREASIVPKVASVRGAAAAGGGVAVAAEGAVAQNLVKAFRHSRGKPFPSTRSRMRTTMRARPRKKASFRRSRVRKQPPWARASLARDGGGGDVGGVAV